jgi:hypothetical protein
VKGTHSPNQFYVAFSALATFILGLVLMVNYHFYVSTGHVSEYGEVLWAISQLAMVFACAGYLMPIAAITFKESEGDDEQQD